MARWVCELSNVYRHDTRGSRNQTSRSFEELSQDVRNLESSIQMQVSEMQTPRTGFAYDPQAIVAMRNLEAAVGTAADSINRASANHHFDIPQSVSSVFTGRDPLLRELRDLIVPPRGITRDQQRRLVVHGLGGSGKTQLCCKFAEDNRDRYVKVFQTHSSFHTILCIPHFASVRHTKCFPTASGGCSG